MRARHALPGELGELERLGAEHQRRIVQVRDVAQVGHEAREALALVRHRFGEVRALRGRLREHRVIERLRQAEQRGDRGADLVDHVREQAPTLDVALHQRIGGGAELLREAHEEPARLLELRVGERLGIVGLAAAKALVGGQEHRGAMSHDAAGDEVGCEGAHHRGRHQHEALRADDLGEQRQLQQGERAQRGGRVHGGLHRQRHTGTPRR